VNQAILLHRQVEQRSSHLGRLLIGTHEQIGQKGNASANYGPGIGYYHIVLLGYQ
jgi:hypothetical protein